jgi:RimJ/RimL family protein N-acetyltransferase
MRVYFRAFEFDDYHLFSKFRNDEDNYKYITGNKVFVSTEREKKWVADKIFDDSKNLYLAVCLQENNHLIGYTSINKIDLKNRNAQWGSIFIEKEFRKQGISNDIGILILKLVFEEMPIYRFYTEILEGQIPSLKLVTRLGFKQEGTNRSAIYKCNQFHNVINVSILKSEYDDFFIQGKYSSLCQL